jgi:RNA polymerase sigma factor (sigma-70 family)
VNPPSQDDSSRRARFRGIYDAGYAALLGYALRRCPTEEDAADVVAETFLVAWRRLEDVPRGDEARPWLYGVARRVLANQRRGELRRGRLTGRLVPELRSWAPADEAEDDADLAAVAGAFERLPRRDREVLELVAWEGLAAREVAVVLGCQVTTARVRLHRARRRFAQELSRAGVPLRGRPDASASSRVHPVESLGEEAL